MTTPDSTATNRQSLSTLLSRLRKYGMNPKESQPHHGTLKRASVLVLITQDGKILLTKRSQQLKSHPGQVCFPGGKRDPEDDNDITTALRETHEEVGLCFSTKGATTISSPPPSKILSELEPLCLLRTIESINHLCVTPIVMYTTLTSDEISNHLQVNTSEVDAAFWTPLTFFKTTSPKEEYEIPWSGETFIYRHYIFNCSDQQKQFDITGLTAHIAHEVSHMALPDDDDNDNTTFMKIGIDNAKESKNKEGYLWRLQNDHRRPYWSRYYFVLSHKDGILHQYDNEQQADRKVQSANKKNRLRMDDTTKIILMDDKDDNNDDSSGNNDDANSRKYAFNIHILDGRVIWPLAASTLEDRNEWKLQIKSSIPHS